MLSMRSTPRTNPIPDSTITLFALGWTAVMLTIVLVLEVIKR